MGIRKWIYYRYLRAIAASYSKIKRMDLRDSENDDIQKSIFKIALKLINKPDTQFLAKESSYFFSNKELSILISYDHQTPTITLISGSDIQKVNLNDEYVRSILASYDREVSRRIRKSFFERNKAIHQKLEEIYQKLG